MRLGRSVLAACAVMGMAATLGGGAALADDEKSHGAKGGAHGMKHQTAGISVESAWARASPGMVKNGAAYVTVANRGEEADRLIAIESDAAKRVTLHENIEDDGVMRMRPVEALDLPAGETVEMKSGGYHIMLIELHNSLRKGDKFPLSLVFEKAGKRQVTVEVMGIGAMHGDGMHDNRTGHGTGHGGHR